MAMLVRNEIDGPYSYCVGYVIPAQSANSVTVHPLQALRGTPTEESTQTLTIDVVAGVPFLMGSVTTDDGAYPAGVNVTLVDPDGNQVRHSEAVDRLVVCVDNDPTMLQSCMIQNPAVGTWTATVTNADSSSYVFFSTIPTEAQYTTMSNTLAPYIDSEALGAAPEGATACWTCHIACWSLGIALTFLLVIGAGLLVAGSAPVSALLCLLASIGITSLTAAGAVLVLQALMASAGATALLVAYNLCTWLNACSTAVTAKITSPTAGATVSGTTQVTASVSNATTVLFYVDVNTPIGTDDTGPNWDTDWETAKFSNGNHTVWAVAANSDGATWSRPVNVTVHN